MKMKHFVLIGVAVLLMFSGCRRDAGNRLVVWSFTDEIQIMIDKFDIENAIGMEIDYSITHASQIQDRLDPVLLAGRGAPDVFALEVSLVRRYIESGMLLDLTELYEEVSGRVLRYPVEMGTHNGRVYGMSWQATPGAMFFRRSLALRYLGTDDPAVVQTYFDNWDSFLATAQLLNERSGGSVAVVSAVDELNNPFMASRTQPWIVDNQLHIDPAMVQYLQVARYLRDNGLDGRAVTWQESWFAGMRGDLADEMGNTVEVFSYFLPTWGLRFVLATNAPDTSGDWGVIRGPAFWFGGGTWLMAWAGTRHPEAAKNMIRLLTTNEDNLFRWGSETGDFLSNIYVTNRIIETVPPPEFLGGQNHFEVFAELAPGIDASLIQGTDEAINGLFLEAVTQYVNAEATLEQVLAMFREQVRSQLGF